MRDEWSSAGYRVGVKVWYHVIAAVVGFSAAALIVFVVFGNASEEGARPSGAAPGSVDTEGTVLCGTILPGAANTPATRSLAAANPPGIASPEGPIASLGRADQKAWLSRVHAAAGLCADEVRFGQDFATTGVLSITMSTVDELSDGAASQLAAGTLAQAFTPPFNPRTVTLVTSSGDSTRRAVVGFRAWDNYKVWRTQLRRPLTMSTLTQFRANVYRGSDLQVTGWR